MLEIGEALNAMAVSFREQLYPHLPVMLQHVACSYYGWRESRNRFGREFERILEGLLVSERWSAAEIANYEDEKLRELVRHAYQTVPFYRARMREAKLAPSDIQARRDLPKLPILTKEEVRANWRSMLSTNARRGEVIARHTSGTSGKAIDFFQGRSGMKFQNAVQWRHRVRFGIRPHVWHVNFTGKLAVPIQQNNPPFWRWNLPWRQVLINMQHITPSKIAAIIGFLNLHRFEFYSGYPSILHALATTAAEAGLKLERPPRLIAMGAENVLDHQRQDLQAFAGAAILTDQWGFSEGCANASHCPELVYHEDFELGIIERVEEHVTAQGRAARLVCTGFASPEFPFLRYDVGDVGAWDPRARPCPCGRQSAVLHQILGRVDDFVVTPEGNRVMRFDYCLKEARQVKECQFVQDRLGEVRLRIVRRPGYSAEDERHLAEEIGRWISPRLVVHFEYVTEIERSGNKFRAVKSNLPGR